MGLRNSSRKIHLWGGVTTVSKAGVNGVNHVAAKSRYLWAFTNYPRTHLGILVQVLAMLIPLLECVGCIGVDRKGLKMGLGIGGLRTVPYTALDKQTSKVKLPDLFLGASANYYEDTSRKEKRT